MLKVLLVFLFFGPHHELVGSQIGGAGSTVPGCQAAAAQILDGEKDKLPKGVTAYPLCIDTGLLPGGDDNKKVDDNTTKL